MAEREADGAPYGATRALIAWVATHWQYLRGRMIRDGIDPMSLDLADVIAVGYSYFVDGEAGFVGAEEVRRQIDTAIETSWLDRETFGMNPDVLDAVPPAKPLDKAPS